MLPVQQMLRMLTIDGARVLGLGGISGSIEPASAPTSSCSTATARGNTGARPGGEPDLFAQSRAVRDVLVDGTLLVRNGRLTWDDEAVLARQQRTRGALKS